MSLYRYAAYGSNLHPLRLQARVPSAELLGVGYLPDYSLTFHKRSAKDGSGKCNVSAGSSGVHVAVYALANSDRSVLDAIEGTGHGYENREIEIDGFGNCSIYIATPDAIDETVHPFDWYHAYVLHGAQFHDFPAHYISPLESLHAVPDDDVSRSALEWSQVEKIRQSIATRPITLRNASPHEAVQLSDLALRSKAHWVYPEDFLEACKNELTYRPDQISNATFDFVVAEMNGSISGFYALERLADQQFELEALFVKPEAVGRGVGRALIKHAIRSVAERDGKSLLIQGDPNAESFYLAAGAEKIGARESGSIAGRSLPLFEIRIQSDAGGTA